MDVAEFDENLHEIREENVHDVNNLEYAYQPFSGVFISNEEWVEIFKVLIPAVGLRTGIQKLRTVCRQWRDIIDNFVDFRVSINDKTWKQYPWYSTVVPVTNYMNLSHLRVSHGWIYNFCKKLPEDHRVVMVVTKSLTFLGDITAENFEKIIECADRPIQLSLCSKPLGTINLIRAPCADNKFQEFCQNISKLDISLETHGTTEETMTAAQESLVNLLGHRMENLRRVTLRMEIDIEKPVSPIFNCSRTTTSIISFLANHARLDSLDVFMRCLASAPPHPFPETCVKVSHLDSSLPQKLPHVNLNRLYVTATSGHLGVWIHVIKLLRKLQHLHVTVKDFYGVKSTHPDTFLLDQLEDALQTNQKTLSLIDLTCFNASRPVDAKIFKGMYNLKRLMLHRNNQNYVDQTIINLGMLPPSIEALELSGMKGNSSGIYSMALNLKKLRTVRLTGMRQLQQGGFGVSEQAKEVFSSRENIEMVIT